MNSYEFFSFCQSLDQQTWQGKLGWYSIFPNLLQWEPGGCPRSLDSVTMISSKCCNHIVKMERQLSPTSFRLWKLWSVIFSDVIRLSESIFYQEIKQIRHHKRSHRENYFSLEKSIWGFKEVETTFKHAHVGLLWYWHSRRTLMVWCENKARPYFCMDIMIWTKSNFSHVILLQNIAGSWIPSKYSHAILAMVLSPGFFSSLYFYISLWYQMYLFILTPPHSTWRA